MRLMSSLGRIDQHHKVRTGRLEEDGWPLTSAVTMLSRPGCSFTAPALQPPMSCARARRLQRQEGQLGLIVVDYLQLMKVPGTEARTRTNEVWRSPGH